MTASDERWRLFIAHPVPSAIRRELTAGLAPYRQRYPDVRWTRPDGWHLTLLFLGSVPPTSVDMLMALCSRVAADAPGPYRVIADRGGGRSDRRGQGVAWLGLSEGADRMLELADLVFDGCPADVADGKPPRRTPSAHLTVARRAEHELIGDLRDARWGPLGASWTVDRIQLVRSHLGRDGARYETLHERPL